MEKRLMNIQELSRYLALPVPSIYSMVSRRKIPEVCVRRIGRALRFDVKAVDEWVDGGSATA